MKRKKNLHKSHLDPGGECRRGCRILTEANSHGMLPLVNRRKSACSAVHVVKPEVEPRLFRRAPEHTNVDQCYIHFVETRLLVPG
jgi:hypothetical protein